MLSNNFMWPENEVDGDSLLALVGLTPGPDCLKADSKNRNTNMSLQDHYSLL